MQTKSFCEDLTEGKFSFPIIHAVNSNPEDTRLLNILRQRTEDVDVKRHAVKWMVSCGSISYTRTVLKQLHSEVLLEIEKLGGHAPLSALIERLDTTLDCDGGAHGEKISARSPPVVQHRKTATSSTPTSTSSTSTAGVATVVNSSTAVEQTDSDATTTRTSEEGEGGLVEDSSSAAVASALSVFESTDEEAGLSGEALIDSL
jgi:hypothetical protein